MPRSGELLTDEQFKVLLEGAGIASGEKLHRLSGLLTAVAGIGENPTKEQREDLYTWAVKIAQDLINHRNKETQK
jgi:hypothetical protein